MEWDSSEDDPWPSALERGACSDEPETEPSLGSSHSSDFSQASPDSEDTWSYGHSAPVDGIAPAFEDTDPSGTAPALVFVDYATKGRGASAMRLGSCASATYAQ